MDTTSLLINGYAKHLNIPQDIINVIKLHYSCGFNINTFLFSTIKRRLCNITSPNLQYPLKWDSNFYLGHSRPPAYFKPKCITNHTSLPPFIQNTNLIITQIHCSILIIGYYYFKHARHHLNCHSCTFLQ